jgi:hypothetical protein
LYGVAGFGEDDRENRTQELRALFEEWKELDVKRQEEIKKGKHLYGSEIANDIRNQSSQIVALLRQYAQVEGDVSRREMIAREVAKLAARTEIRFVFVFVFVLLLGFSWIDLIFFEFASHKHF